MRGDPAFRVAERRAVAQPNQREELIELAVPSTASVRRAGRAERNRVFVMIGVRTTPTWRR